MLVLGAGPVGLAMAKALKEARIPYDHVETTDHVGGNWAHGVYTTAHIISSKKTTQYSDFPMPADYPDFPSAAQMKAYFESYADAFSLEEDLEFNRRVERVTARDDGLWDVLVDDEPRTYKGVFLCNGHHWSKRLPTWTRDFAGEVLHSKDYKTPEQLAGKRVLVLGGGNSGCDLASEAARVGRSCDHSLRRGYWFMPKTVFGLPSVELINPWAPVFLQRLGLRILIFATIGRYTDYGLPKPDHKPFEAHPTVNSEIFHYLKHGRITPRRDVRSVDGKQITFVDGSSAEFDLVACATGYDLAFPMLEEGLVPIEGKNAKLIGGALLPGHKNLFVVGTMQPRYGLGPLVRPFAVLAASWVRLQDRMELPLADVLVRAGARPPKSHLLDPHAALRAIWLGRRMGPWLRWLERRMRTS